MTREKRPKRHDKMLELESVVRWRGQLNESGISSGIKINTYTRAVYLSKLYHFNEWLVKREFTVRVPVVKSKRTVRESRRMPFANVEVLLHFGEDDNAKKVKRIVQDYLAVLRDRGLSNSTMAGACSAIKSYFDTNDVVVNVKPHSLKRNGSVAVDETKLTLPEFYKMMTVGKMNRLTRAVLMVKFQAGLDRSTLADRFNFHAYAQIAKFCGTKNHREWSLDKCPIPIRLVRVKTGVQFTTFIDRDALAALKDYLAWREENHPSHDPDGPIFITTKGEPVSVEWVSHTFAKGAKYSMTQKRLGPRKVKLTSHSVRHLLKTTLITCGYDRYVADYAIGHAPDTYERPDLCPDKLRREYAKASHAINIISKAASKINDMRPANAMEKDLEASKAKVEELEKKVNELKAEIAKKNARSADAVSKLDMVVRAIIDASGDPDGDFRQNLKDRLGGLP